jgi:hypothetical protein
LIEIENGISFGFEIQMLEKSTIRMHLLLETFSCRDGQTIDFNFSYSKVLSYFGSKNLEILRQLCKNLASFCNPVAKEISSLRNVIKHATFSESSFEYFQY